MALLNSPGQKASVRLTKPYRRVASRLSLWKSNTTFRQLSQPASTRDSRSFCIELLSDSESGAWTVIVLSPELIRNSILPDAAPQAQGHKPYPKPSIPGSFFYTYIGTIRGHQGTIITIRAGTIRPSSDPSGFNYPVVANSAARYPGQEAVKEARGSTRITTFTTGAQCRIAGPRLPEGMARALLTGPSLGFEGLGF